MAQPATPGAKLVVPVHTFDTAALAAYLHREVGDAAHDLTVEQFQGGQSNPTYRVTTADRRYVLRRKPPGTLLPSAHAVDREYRVMSALAATDVPVPKMYALCEDDAVIGTAFYLMEYVHGRILWDPTLPGMTPGDRAAHYDELNRVLATLHRVDYKAINLRDFGKPGQYISRQVVRWSEQYQAGSAEPIPAMDRLIEWLPQHIPPGDETSIVHGDFRIDNVIFHPMQPRALAVLDWELSTLGHPLSDFAYQVMAWRLTPQEFRGLKGFDLRVLGIPAEEDYVAAYCRRTGRSGIPHWEFYLIFNMFRIAAILHGVLSRALQGNAASQNAIETGVVRAWLPTSPGTWRRARHRRRNDVDFAYGERGKDLAAPLTRFMDENVYPAEPVP
jgi:aminoglycoside phosphotransferase (APT) family kinase protein